MSVLVGSAAWAALLLAQAGPVATAPRSDAAPTATAPAATTPSAAALDGSTSVEVRARLGEPAVAHAEGAGAMWTYRLPRCALFVYFSDAGQGLRVSGTETGPRRHGETPPDATACLAAVPPPAPAAGAPG